MLIADSQVHIWEASTPQRPWAADRKPHRDIPLTANDLLREMDAAGVARAVLVPPSWDGGRNDLALDAARAHLDRFAVMGRLNIEKPETRGTIAGLRDQPGLYGLRFSFTPARWATMIGEGQLDWFWVEAEKAQLPLMVMIKNAMVPLIDGIAQRHPRLKLTMCHLALPNGAKDEQAFANLDRLLGLARRPNINVKITALPDYTDDTYPYRRLHPYLRRVYDAFGPQRIFWGTDLSRLHCTYRQAVTMITEEISWLTDADKEWIMGRGLCEWLGWKIP